MKTIKPQLLEAGQALSQCNRCGCIGPRAMVVGRLYIYARYSLRTRIV